MMIKVSNEFLDFNDLIEVEKQIKLFEELSTTDGDFSYDFELEKTLVNTRLLQNPFPDNINKPVYQKIPAKLLSDSGAETYDGYLRVEGVTKKYRCSFFAGNNNWFGMLSGKLSELDWSEFDIDLTQSNIQNAIFNTDGLVFPLLDNGGLLTRGFAHMKVEDYVAGLYVKTIFNKIFSAHGIKIKGELLNDTNFDSAFTIKNGKSKELIEAGSANIEKNITQSFTASSGVEQVTWDADSPDPFFNNGNFNLATESYTPGIKMILKIDLFLEFEQPALQSVIFQTHFRVNGTPIQSVTTFTADDDFTLSKTFTLTVLGTDVIDIAIEKIDPPDFDIVSGTIKFTPVFVYKSTGSSMIPDWTQQQYVSNVLQLFNALPSYHEPSQTLTLNLFEKIKSKPAIDLSEYISETEVDYSEFISDYGKKSLLSYKEFSEDDFRPVHFPYAKGEIDVNNDFLPDSSDIVEVDFTNPISYINTVFDMSIEKTNLIKLDEDTKVDISGVSDSLGQARFAITEDIFAISDLVRVTNSTNPAYNGDWMVETLGTGYVELSGLSYSTGAIGEIIKLNFFYEDTDNVFFMHHVPLYSVSKFSGKTSIRLENTDLETMALGFFNLLNTGRQINKDFIYSLSFSGEDNELHYQLTMIEQYFKLTGHVLNDPVKLFCTAQLPYTVYNGIDFLRPVMVRTIETSNLYYLNRITGYKESYYDCMLELIKLSSGVLSAVIPSATPPTPPVEPPQILQAIQFGIANGNVLDFNFTDPMTIGSKVLFVGCNVANGATSPTVSETTGNVNMGNSIDVGRHLMKDPTGATNVGYVFFEVIDITDVDDVFQFTFSAADGNTHYSAGFAVEISPGAEWDTSYLGLVDSAIGYDVSGGLPMFTTGVVLSSVPNVITTEAGNLFIPFGFSMGLSPDGNFFQAPFDGVNPSGSVNPAGVLMGMAWNAVELAAGDAGPLVYETDSGISGVRQWLSWGNFFTP